MLPLRHARLAYSSEQSFLTWRTLLFRSKLPAQRAHNMAHDAHAFGVMVRRTAASRHHHKRVLRAHSSMICRTRCGRHTGALGNRRGTCGASAYLVLFPVSLTYCGTRRWHEHITATYTATKPPNVKTIGSQLASETIVRIRRAHAVNANSAIVNQTIC